VIDLGVMVPTDKILKEAIEQKVDMIGLSGLITPSLDEMAHVAKEMQRQGFEMPLLIGGATTSRIHTAVKIAPHYNKPVVHVLDASRAVGVVGSLISEDLRDDFVTNLQTAQEGDRESHRNKREQKPLLPIEEARNRRMPIEWKAEDIAKPNFIGLKVQPNIPLEEIVPYIDWSPFFQAFELKGLYPQIFEDETVGEVARNLFEDGQKILDRIIKRRQLKANVVYGFYPANSVGDDVEVYRDESRTELATKFHFLRQQIDKPAGRYDHCLSDFIAPKESGIGDYIGIFAVTAGIGLDHLVMSYKKEHDDESAFLAQALADRLAEALAEMVHQRARVDCGYGEELSNEDLIAEKYRGIRPAPGYPACPDHSEKRALFDLLDAERKAGISLTESFAMTPASSVSGFYFAHPQSQYFAVGKINRDQILDISERKGTPPRDTERVLLPNLNYDPDDFTE
ncbi:MAG TPA: vitamin B12 dependent-methionine synthase activation domain-containing protein, partial [Abditibacteriaceae bacterium]